VDAADPADQRAEGAFAGVGEGHVFVEVAAQLGGVAREADFEAPVRFPGLRGTVVAAFEFQVHAFGVRYSGEGLAVERGVLLVGVDGVGVGGGDGVDGDTGQVGGVGEVGVHQAFLSK